MTCTWNQYFYLFVKGDYKTACVPPWLCFTCLLSCFPDCFIFLLGQTHNFTAGMKDVDGRSRLSFLDIAITAQSGEQKTAFGQDQHELSHCAWMRKSNPWLKGSDLSTLIWFQFISVWLSCFSLFFGLWESSSGVINGLEWVRCVLRVHEEMGQMGQNSK